MSVAAADHEHVAGLVGAGHHLLAERVDRAAADDGAGSRQPVAARVPSAWTPGTTRGSASGEVPAAAARAASQPTKSNSGHRGHRGGRVDGADAGQRVVGHRLGGPVAGGIRCAGR